MLIRYIASAVIAALMVGGIAMQAPTVPEQATQIQAVTPETAQRTALIHVGLTEAEVTRLQIHKDWEGGIPVYEVEFRAGDFEYDVDIHADTGAVLQDDKEYDPAPTPPAAPPVTEPAPPATQPAPPVTEPAPPVTEPAAPVPVDPKAIALAHAGFTEAEVTRLHVKKDLEDGIPVYEVEFRAGDFEYDFDIHAETGAVLHHDKEYDPAPTPPAAPPATEPVPPVTQPAPPVTEPAAPAPVDPKTIALAHAGLTAEQVRKLETEADWERGVPVWEVEFEFQGWEYSYEIHRETGAILFAEKEWDD